MSDETTAPPETHRALTPVWSSGGKIAAIIPQSFDDCFRLAKLLASTAMVPADYQGKPEDCCVAIMQGLEVGMAPLAALQSIAVINGRPSIWGDGALGIVRASGLMEKFEETDDPDKEGGTATCTVKRRHEPALTRTFSMRQASQANLGKKDGPWRSYPERMRQMRARSWALRDGFADVLKGLHIAEESQDIPMRDITPAQAPATTSFIEDIPEPDIQPDTKAAELKPAPEDKPDKKPAMDGIAKAIAPDALFLDQLGDAYATARTLNDLNEHMVQNEMEVEDRGLEQAAADLYRRHKDRIYAQEACV